MVTVEKSQVDVGSNKCHQNKSIESERYSLNGGPVEGKGKGVVRS